MDLGIQVDRDTIRRWVMLFEDKVKERYPMLASEDKEFTGAINTNAMEGGNFRIKWNLRVPYSNLHVCGGRVILGAIYDSLYTFRNGRPCESFAHKHSTFGYADIMGYEGGGIQSNVSVEPPFEGELCTGLAEALVN